MDINQSDFEPPRQPRMVCHKLNKENQYHHQGTGIHSQIPDPRTLSDSHHEFDRMNVNH